MIAICALIGAAVTQIGGVSGGPGHTLGRSTLRPFEHCDLAFAGLTVFDTAVLSYFMCKN